MADQPVQSGGAQPVLLDFKFMWCARHLEPFRATWPKGAALAMVNLFSASACDERIAAAAQGDTHRLSPVLREHGPMCCFLPATITEQVIEASLAGQKWEPPTAFGAGEGVDGP